MTQTRVDQARSHIVSQHLSRNRRNQQRNACTQRRGATLVELIVAMVLLSIGLFSVVGTSGSVVRQLGGGRNQTVAAAIAQARLDSLTSIGCQSLTPGGATSSGTSTTRSIKESWTVIDGFNVKTIQITMNVPGRTVPILYETIIPCRD